MSNKLETTTSKVRNVGNSMGVIIPKEVRKKLALSLEDEILFSEDSNGNVVVSLVERKPAELSQQFIIDFIIWAKATIQGVDMVFVDDGVVYVLNAEEIGFFDNTHYTLEDSQTVERLIAMYRAALSAE